MKSAAFCLLVLCVVGARCEQFNGGSLRGLLGSASVSSSASSKSDSPKGRASARASAKSTGGSAEAIASATSKAFADVENSVVEYFEYAFNNISGKKKKQSKTDYCVDAMSILEKKLDAVGKVTASAYADALGTVEVTGSGAACASGESSAASQADGFAKILVDAAAEAKGGPTEAAAKTQVDLVLNVIASAFAEAFATACVKGEGSALAVQETLTKAVIKPIATVTVLAAAGVDCGDVEGYAASESTTAAKSEEEFESKSTSETEVEGEGQAEVAGTGGAFTAELESCSGVFRLCCSSRFTRKDKCPCSLSKRSSRARCAAKKVDSEDGSLRWYDQDKGVYCSCSFKSFALTIIY